jgi:hypothetical protein
MNLKLTKFFLFAMQMEHYRLHGAKVIMSIADCPFHRVEYFQDWAKRNVISLHRDLEYAERTRRANL